MVQTMGRYGPILALVAVHRVYTVQILQLLDAIQVSRRGVTRVFVEKISISSDLFVV